MVFVELARAMDNQGCDALQPLHPASRRAVLDHVFQFCDQRSGSSHSGDLSNRRVIRKEMPFRRKIEAESERRVSSSSPLQPPLQPPFQPPCRPLAALALARQIAIFRWSAMDISERSDVTRQA